MEHAQLKDYLHESDGRLVRKLMDTKGVDKILKFIKDNKIEEICRYIYDASFVRLTSSNSPEFYKLWERACDFLMMDDVPKIYITRDFYKQIEIGGFSEPFMIVSSYYLENVSKEALYGLIVSRLAGICAEHHKPLFFEWVLSIAGPYLPAPVTFAMKAIINDWRRCRYFTYDRAFYLAVKDYALTVRQIFYPFLSDDDLRRFNFESDSDEFEEQLKRFKENNKSEKLFKMYQTMASDGIWLPDRYNEIKEYAEKGGVI